MTHLRGALAFAFLGFFILLQPLFPLGPSIAKAGGTIAIDDVRSFSIGMGVRSSFDMMEHGSPDGKHWSNEFELDSVRLYLDGRLLKYVYLEVNTEYNEAPPGALGAPGTETVRILDAVVKFEFNDYINFWTGRLLPPSDRSNLSGPYYLNSWDFPAVQKYPNAAVGRDNGAAFWGQIGGGQFKYQVGVFEGKGDAAGGPNTTDELLYAGRLVLNLWDPEPGYYNSSTYFGGKNVFALGLAGMYQKTGTTGTLGAADIQDWNADLLIERNLADLGVPTLEAAYYYYNLGGHVPTAGATGPLGDGPEGKGYFVLASYLFPGKTGPGKIQPLVRYQQFNNSGLASGDGRRIDAALSYILDGHNARVTADFGNTQPPGVSGLKKFDTFQIGLQFQI